MKKVLFVCIHNSARSQMAEAYLNQLGVGRFVAYSAGIEPGKLNPLVVDVLREDGIDISHHQTKSVQSFLDQREIFDYVITVCDETSAERCPAFPGKHERLHWGFPDPSSFVGDPADKLAFTRQVRDQIRQKIVVWLTQYK